MKKIFHVLFALAILAGFATQASAQCNNTSQFGSATVNTAGTVTTISTCSWGGEYSPIFGAVAGQTLKFTSSVGTDYITVRAGSPSGPVLAHGTGPLTVSNTFTGTLYAHWNTNSSCGTQNVCRTTTVQCVSCVAPTFPNDLCSGATSISCGQSVNGTTVGAGPDASAPTCGTTVGTGGAVWYKVIGTGGFIEANTCGGTTNYDSKLHVYTGSCSGLVCVTGNDDNCGLQSRVTWCSQQGTVYYILVNGYLANQGNFTLNVLCTTPSLSINPVGPLCVTGASVGLSANLSGGTFSGPGVSGSSFNPAAAGVGTHTITYTLCGGSATTTITVLAAPSNDLCSGALRVNCGGSYQGSTTCSSIDGGLPFCGTTGGTAGGNWYTLDGTGGFVSLSTCNAFTNYDSKIHVFTGACGSFTCVAGNDDYSSTTQTCNFSSLRSLVQFCTTPGTTYYILVHGFSSATGNYQLDVNCSAPLSVDAGACQTRFLGYTGPGAPASTNYICPSISGGTAPYNVSFSPSAEFRCSNGCYAVEPTTTTTYTVTVTDANGCSASDQVTVNVIDVAAACNGQNQIQICHYPPGNTGNPQTICVGYNAVAAHLLPHGRNDNHGGDHLGPCGNTCLSTNAACEASSCDGGTFTITISGTGYLDETTWSFGGSSGGPYGFGTTNSATVTLSASQVPANFSIETQGSFNDNVANYSISCGGGVIASGTINGGLTLSENGLCCNTQLAPKVSGTKGAGLTVAPNPFNETTTFKFRSAKAGTASIVLFNLAGKQIATVFEGQVAEQGTYEVDFNAQGLSAGVYLYRYTNAEGATSTGKVNLVR